MSRLGPVYVFLGKGRCSGTIARVVADDEERARAILLRHSIYFEIEAVAREPIDDETDVYECDWCSSLPGSPTLCSECLRRRAAAGERWRGPRPGALR